VRELSKSGWKRGEETSGQERRSGGQKCRRDKLRNEVDWRRQESRKDHQRKREERRVLAKQNCTGDCLKLYAEILKVL